MKEWWKNFFVNDLFISCEEKVKDDINFLKGILPKKARVLDLGCGKGMHVMQLKSLGYKVIGLDWNENYIIQARRNYKGCSFICGDMRSIKFKCKFDAILLLFNTFGYFTHSENERLLANCSSHLNKNGLLILQSSVKEDLRLRKKSILKVKSCSVKSFCKWSKTKDWVVLHTKFVLPSGKILKSKVYVYSLKKLEEMGIKCALKLIKVMDVGKWKLRWIVFKKL